MHPILKTIHARPGMYFGDGRLPFTSFGAFLSGYNIGRSSVEKPESGLPEHLVPLDFDAFVYRHFGLEPGIDTKGWMGCIRERTASEKEAYDLLFTLLESYERNHTA